MIFEINEKVKTFTEVGLMKKPRWLLASFLDHVPPYSAMLEINGNKVISNYNRIKKYRPLEKNFKGEYQELNDFVNKYWDSLKKLISMGVNKLLLPKPPVIEINEEDKIISIESGWISICPEIKEYESIIEFFEKPTWSVSVAASTSGGMWEPENTDICEVGEQSNVVCAAQLFVETAWKEINRGFWESAGDYEF